MYSVKANIFADSFVAAKSFPTETEFFFIHSVSQD